MKKGISLVLVMFLIMGLGCAAFADGALDVVGTVEGQIYTSKTLRLKAEFPEDWILLSDEQIAAEMEFPEGYNTREGLARLLEEYYTSGEWRGDYEADEAGLLPPDLKRGVLSQDGVYNLLEHFKEGR